MGTPPVLYRQAPVLIRNSTWKPYGRVSWISLILRLLHSLLVENDTNSFTAARNTPYTVSPTSTSLASGFRFSTLSYPVILLFSFLHGYFEFHAEIIQQGNRGFLMAFISLTSRAFSFFALISCGRGLFTGCEHDIELLVESTPVLSTRGSAISLFLSFVFLPLAPFPSLPTT